MEKDHKITRGIAEKENKKRGGKEVRQGERPEKKRGNKGKRRKKSKKKCVENDYYK